MIYADRSKAEIKIDGDFPTVLTEILTVIVMVSAKGRRKDVSLLEVGNAIFDNLENEFRDSIDETVKMLKAEGLM